MQLRHVWGVHTPRHDTTWVTRVGSAPRHDATRVTWAGSVPRHDTTWATWAGSTPRHDMTQATRAGSMLRHDTVRVTWVGSVPRHDMGGHCATLRHDVGNTGGHCASINHNGKSLFLFLYIKPDTPFLSFCPANALGTRMTFMTAISSHNGPAVWPN